MTGQPGIASRMSQKLQISEIPTEKIDYHNVSGLDFLKWVANKDKRARRT